MSKKNIADQENKIKDSLLEFVKTHITGADLNLIDEIVLSYVVAILEDVSSDPVFDVEDFCEMMSAYFPEFESINHATVCQWIFELEAKLREIDHCSGSRSAAGGGGAATIDISLPEILPKSVKPRLHSSSNSDSGNESVVMVAATTTTTAPRRRLHKLSELSDGGSTDSSAECYDYIDEIDMLQEMFPHVCSLEVRHCLTIASGNIERATQLLIDRQESGLCLMLPHNSVTLQIGGSGGAGVKTKKIDDAELKNRIIERYSYVDKDSFVKEHRPVAPKVEPKKLVRYRDNKIVSLKGERFTEVKKGEDVDDISMRKNKKGHTP